MFRGRFFVRYNWRGVNLGLYIKIISFHLHALCFQYKTSHTSRSREIEMRFCIFLNMRDRHRRDVVHIFEARVFDTVR